VLITCRKDEAPVIRALTLLPAHVLTWFSESLDEAERLDGDGDIVQKFERLLRTSSAGETLRRYGEAYPGEFRAFNAALRAGRRNGGGELVEA
jgi:hypothetical protein